MVDKSAYRDAMAGLAAAVNIITSNGEAGLAGCTVSAVCSVTDEPPTLLVCINRSSANNEIIRKNGNLCVNVLSAEQKTVAMQFATKGLSISERAGLRQLGHSRNRRSGAGRRGLRHRLRGRFRVRSRHAHRFLLPREGGPQPARP
ncbi:flavin reductase (DIM6/NTAB) family NADH-FMN oxidoreductase RutF [Rhizobium sp. OAE497]